MYTLQAGSEACLKPSRVTKGAAGDGEPSLPAQVPRRRLQLRQLLKLRYYVRRQSAHRAAIGIVRVRRGAAAAARGAGRRRRHGRVDRHLPCRPAPDAAGHVRLPDRQRRRRTKKTTCATSSSTSAPTCPRERIVPFLTSKHSIEYCLSYAERAHQSGFPALVVLAATSSWARRARSNTRALLR